jgi:hypothetical protein
MQHRECRANACRSEGELLPSECFESYTIMHRGMQGAKSKGTAATSKQSSSDASEGEVEYRSDGELSTIASAITRRALALREKVGRSDSEVLLILFPIRSAKQAIAIRVSILVQVYDSAHLESGILAKQIGSLLS